MDPIVQGAAISAGANLLGGLFGSKSAKKDRKLAKYQFDQQMDYSIQRRVADAQKAGIHPLFALGGSVGASPTMHAGGSGSSWAETARNIGDAVGGAVAAKGQKAQAARAAAQQDALFDKQMQKIDAEIGSERSLSMLHDAEAAKLRSDLASTGRDTQALRDNEMIPENKRLAGQSAEIGSLYKQYRDPDTGNLVRLYHPDVGADELIQVQILAHEGNKKAQRVVDEAKRYTRKKRVQMQQRRESMRKTRRGLRPYR